MANPIDCSMGARIVFAVLGVIIGLSIAIVFGAEYHNANAAIWGFISGVAAAFTLYVHISYLKNWYEENPAPLRNYMYCGCFFQLVGICGLVAYIVLAAHEHQGIVVYGPGYYLTAVWCFMTLKWGFQLFYFSRDYWRNVTSVCQLLPAPEKCLETDDYGANKC